MCQRSCHATHALRPCPDCLDEWLRDMEADHDLDALCAADPARTRGHEYATEAEWREHLNETTGPERRAA